MADAITALTDLGVPPAITIAGVVTLASLLYKRFRQQAVCMLDWLGGLDVLQRLGFLWSIHVAAIAEAAIFICRYFTDRG